MRKNVYNDVSKDSPLTPILWGKTEKQNKQTNKQTSKQQQQYNVPVGRIPCRDSCGGRSSPSVVWSPVCALPSDDSAAVSCTPPVGLSSRLPACCVPGAAWQSGFEAGWWQTCHHLHGGAVATKDKKNELTSKKSGRTTYWYAVV